MAVAEKEIRELTAKWKWLLCFQVILPLIVIFIGMFCQFMYCNLKPDQTGKVILTWPPLQQVDLCGLFRADFILYCVFIVLGILLELSSHRRGSLMEDPNIRETFGFVLCYLIVLLLLYGIFLFFEHFITKNAEAGLGFLVFLFLITSAIIWMQRVKCIIIGALIGTSVTVISED